MSTRITIVIPNWNGEALLRQCLQSLAAQHFKEFEIIVVDNASTDGSVEMVKREFPSVEVFFMPENLGFSRAVNFGIQQSRSPFLLLLNNDTVVEENCLAALYERITDEDARCAGLQCRMMNVFDRQIVDSLGIQIRRRNFHDLEHDKILNAAHKNRGRVLGLCAGAALYRREFFDEVGLFDERFFAGFEDVDISLRGLRRGWYFTYEPEAVVYHHRSRTFNTLSFRKQLELRKNYFLLGFKNFPRRYFWRLSLRLLNVLQKDFFNSVAHLRKGRFAHLRRMYGAIFSNLGAVLEERHDGGLGDGEFKILLEKSERHGIWQP